MAQGHMFTEDLGNAVKPCKCHSVNKKTLSSEDKKRVTKVWDRTGGKEKEKRENKMKR